MSSQYGSLSRLLILALVVAAICTACDKTPTGPRSNVTYQPDTYLEARAYGGIRSATTEPNPSDRAHVHVESIPAGAGLALSFDWHTADARGSSHTGVSIQVAIPSESGLPLVGRHEYETLSDVSWDRARLFHRESRQQGNLRSQCWFDVRSMTITIFQSEQGMIEGSVDLHLQKIAGWTDVYTDTGSVRTNHTDFGTRAHVLARFLTTDVHIQ